MTCGLGVDELFILNVLYGDRCLRKNRSYNLGQIGCNFRAKFRKNPEDTARELVGKGYLTPVPKRDTKYFISDIAMACFALNQHGYSATPGRILPGRVHKL